MLDIGLCGTEGVYFATFDLKLDGGVMVTASHNPPDYNGLKLVREQSKPIGSDSGLKDIAAMIASGKLPPPAAVKGKVEMLDTSARYIEHLLGYVNRKALRKLKVVVDAGNGGAGLAIDKLEPHLPFEFIKVRHEPNGKFPQGVPNPMLEENRGPTLEALRKSGADVGIAWDGDYDRCFFYDSKGAFIEGYYIVGLLAEAFLVKQPGARIVYDPRLTWNTIDTVKRLGGVPVMSKSGHAFIKQKMREVDGAYGGEMSAHHYFRDFSYCDSGMIPWLLVLERVCESGKSLDELVAARIKAFPVERRDQSQAARCEEGAGRSRGEVRQGRHHRSHRRTVRGPRRLALQRARLQYRTAGAAQRRVARQRSADAREDRRAAGVPRLHGRRQSQPLNGVRPHFLAKGDAPRVNLPSEDHPMTTRIHSCASARWRSFAVHWRRHRCALRHSCAGREHRKGADHRRHA